MKKLFFSFLCAISLGAINSYAAIVPSQYGYFEANLATDCMPAAINFNSLSTPVGTFSKIIYFGDGSSGVSWSGTSISNTYSYAGTYDVWVEYRNSFGTTIQWDYCRIELFGQPGPINNYGSSMGCIGDKIRFYVDMGWESSPSNTYTWDFGDGTSPETSNDRDVKHVFASNGTFNITVTANGPCGTYVSNGTFTITTGVPMTASMASVYLPVNLVCPNTDVYLYYSDDFPGIFISYGDGTYSMENNHMHAYSSAGIYYPSITVTNGCGNSMTFSDTITIATNLDWSSPGSGYISVNNSSPACPGTEVNFDAWANAQSYAWYTSSGGLITTDNNFSQTFTTSVNDSVRLVLTNGCGFDTTLWSVINIVTTLPVSPSAFNPNVPSNVCTNAVWTYAGEVFGDQNTGMIYYWDFGDGTPVAENYMGNHVYNTPGTYVVNVIAKNSCGNDTTASYTVTAGSGIAPDANSLFIGVPDGDATCPGDSAFIFGLYYNPGGTYYFDFGDGTNSSTVTYLPIMEQDYFYVKHAFNAVGSYTVTCKYTNECGLSITKSTNVNVGSNETPSGGVFYDQNKTICFGEPVEFLSFGGSEFQWNFGDGTGTLITTGVFSPVPHVYDNPGSYTVTLMTTNSCGNVASNSTNITIPDNKIYITTNTIDAQCLQANGKAIAVITGGNPPYNVTWSNGSTTILVDSLLAGIYVCNVTDQNKCYNFGIATLSDAQAPAIVVNTVFDVTCNGGNDGVIDINVIGSTPPYSFSWSNGATTEDLSGLVAGPYEVYVRDANGCIATASISVDQPDEVLVSFNSTDSRCGLADGSITALAQGNSGPFTYVWNSGEVGATLNFVGLGIYTVNVIDSKGCVVTSSSTVNEDNGSGGPVIALSSMSELNCSGGGSTIDIEVFFASGSAVTYDWSNGASTQDITVTTAGTYTVTATDISGCSAMEIFTVNHAIPNGQNICMVSVDSMYNANKIIWEKPVSTEIKQFNIYRESSMAGLYYLVGSVDYDSLSEFIDVVANPMIQAWRYKVAAQDFCGTESSWSASHKTIHLNQNLGLAPGSVNLIWDDYEGFGYSTFNVVKYTATGGYTTLASISALNHSYTDPAAPLSDSTLFYVITLDLPSTCFASRAQNNNTVRSNRTDNAIAAPSVGTGINELNNNYGYANIYPNPANSNVTVEFEVKNSGDYAVQIYNAFGQKVAALPCGKVDLFCKKEINISSFERGIYTVSIVSKNGKITKRLIKL